MIITIWRHGEAGSAASDRQRELTARGRADIDRGCSQFNPALQARGLPQPALILFSPWVRTSQTARIIASVFDRAAVQATESLRPGKGPATVDDLLTGLAKTDDAPGHLLLVSHQPLVSRLADHYLGPSAGVPALTPGALVTLDLPVPGAACGRLLFWSVPPTYEARL